jgi:hypothetical protein
VKSRGAALVAAVKTSAHPAAERGSAKRGTSPAAAAATPAAAAATAAAASAAGQRSVGSLLRGVHVLLTGFSVGGAELWPSACKNHVPTPTLDDLRGLVARLGGRVVNTLIDVEREDVRSLVIAHPASLRSMKYLFSIARGVPPIHWQWLQHCERDGKLLPQNRCVVWACRASERACGAQRPPRRRC